jgi:hypothetical protein
VIFFHCPSGIDVNPKSIEADELVEHAWKVMEPYYHDSIDKICDAYHQAKSKGTGSMNEIAGSGSRKGRNPINRSRTSNSGKITSDTGTIEKGS